MNGIEIYTEQGAIMRIGRVGPITAESSGLRAFPDGTGDPRKVETTSSL
jgi:hypothetical protein